MKRNVKPHRAALCARIGSIQQLFHSNADMATGLRHYYAVINLHIHISPRSLKAHIFFKLRGSFFIYKCNFILTFLDLAHIIYHIEVFRFEVLIWNTI